MEDLPYEVRQSNGELIARCVYASHALALLADLAPGASIQIDGHYVLYRKIGKDVDLSAALNSMLQAMYRRSRL